VRKQKWEDVVATLETSKGDDEAWLQVLGEAYAKEVRAILSQVQVWRHWSTSKSTAPVPASVIRKIIEVFPNAARDLALLPLHCVLRCQSLASDDTLIQAFLDANPNAMWMPDEEGNLPLHIICRNAFLWDFTGRIDACIRGFGRFISPEAAKWKNKDGNTPLMHGFEMTKGGVDQETVQFAAETNRTRFVEEKGGDNGQSLPLFITVLRAYPGVLHEQSGKQGHRYGDNKNATFYQALQDISYKHDEPFGETRRVVMKMAYPGNTIRTRNADGDFPIHAAVAAQKYSRFVWDVMAQTADTVKEADNKGRVTLNVYIQESSKRQPNKRMLKHLIRLYPQAVNIPDHDGQTAFHAAFLPDYPERCKTIKHLAPHVVASTLATPLQDGRLLLHAHLLADVKEEDDDCTCTSTSTTYVDGDEENAVMDTMVSIYPAALAVPDPASGLYPFVAACAYGVKHVNTLYSALRLHPDVLIQGVGEQPSSNTLKRQRASSEDSWSTDDESEELCTGGGSY
jgi:hypothetical protein